MYQPMLYLHWKQIRVGLIPFVIASFGLPLMAVEGLGTPSGADGGALEAYRFLSAAQPWLFFLPVLAAAVGATLALSAWNWDHRYDHVYALSLPVTRWEYVTLKMGAGALLALLPTASLWLGAHLATASISLPVGLHAYPNQLAVRFLLAVLLSYAVIFAMAAGTFRTTLWVVSTAAGLLVLGTVGTGVLGMYYEPFAGTDFVLIVLRWLSEAPGPFEVFTGNWSLIDV